jgi:hypothetical protein
MLPSRMQVPALSGGLGAGSTATAHSQAARSTLIPQLCNCTDAALAKNTNVRCVPVLEKYNQNAVALWPSCHHKPVAILSIAVCFTNQWKHSPHPWQCGPISGYVSHRKARLVYAFCHLAFVDRMRTYSSTTKPVSTCIGAMGARAAHVMLICCMPLHRSGKVPCMPA